MPTVPATPDTVPATPDTRPATPDTVPASAAYPLRLAIVLQALISAGDGLAMVALASRVYQGSRAAWAVAAVFLVMSVPITALAPLAGLLLDRLHPRPVLVSAAAAQAFVAVALTQVHSTGAVLALATGFGLCAALLQPGLGSIVPRLTPPGGVTRANGYLQAATWGGFTAGPLMAGGLMALGGTGAALAAVAGLYALGAVALRALPLASAGTSHGEDGGRERLVRQLGAGLRFLRTDAESGLLVGVVAIMVAFANMSVVVEVVFAERVLRSGPTGYAILVAAWTAGMLGGTLAGGRVPRRGLAMVTLVGTVATGAGIILAGAASALWQAMAAYGFGGLANGMETVATRSFLNHRAPSAIAGRVFALYSGVLFGAASLGMAAAGGFLAALGARLVLLIAGSGGVAAGAAGLVSYRRLARPDGARLAADSAERARGTVR